MIGPLDLTVTTNLAIRNAGNCALALQAFQQFSTRFLVDGAHDCLVIVLVKLGVTLKRRGQ
ncbi:hypothetical protein M3570_22370 [Bacillus subtilis]|uniref:hypothetical protein n=1 Tax=Bacillus subtilis TaxID=1423 RepID=UPI002040066A|nr:hypothetical protein [Bacillus subtilis]MCM3016410.1 hypothetical protein [Bacillus subtilis]